MRFILSIYYYIFFLVFSSSGNLYGKVEKNTIAIAWENTPRTFDPRYAIDAESQYLENLLHCSLIDFDPNGSIVSDVAKSWKWLNPKLLEMEIKDNVFFADGNKLTPADVKKTYEFFMQKKHKIPTPRAGAFKDLKSITVTKNTLQFALHQADSTFIANLAVGILPSKYITEDLVDSSTTIPGCGPFVLNKVKPNTLSLAVNSKYSLGDAPKIGHVEIKIVKDESTRYAKLRKGEIDIAQNNISVDKIKVIEKSFPQLKILKKPSLKTSYLGFNIQDKLLMKKEVRQAISLAINRPLIIKYLLNGMALEANTMLPPNHRFYNTQIPKNRYDPQKANKILDQAGLVAKDQAYRFQLSYKTTQNQTRLGIAKAIASDLKKIGIQVKVQSLEWGRFKADVDKGHVQMWGLSWIGFKDPDIYRYAFGTESFPPNGGNRGRFSNSSLDEYLRLGKITVNPEQRLKHYLKVQEIVANHLPYAFLFHEENYAVVQKNVQNFALFADGRYASLKHIYKTE